MAIDMNRIIQAAAQAALEGQNSGPRQQPSERSKRKGLRGPRALLIGAGMYTVGRLVVRARSGGLLEGLQQRLTDYESRHDGDEETADEDFDEDPAGEFDEDEEPEDDEDEEPQGEYDEDEEPEGEYDEDEEPEGEYDEDEEPQGEYDDDEEPEDEDDEDDETHPRRTSSAGGRRNGRH